MIYLPSFIIGFIFTVFFRTKNFSVKFSFLMPIIGMVLSWILYSYITAGYLHEITNQVIMIIIIGGLVGSIIGQMTYYLILKCQSKLYEKYLRLLSLISGIIVLIIVFLILIFDYFSMDISIREELPDTLPLLTTASFKENMIRGLSTYHSRAYDFEFVGFKDVPNCTLTPAQDFLDDDLFERTILPFKIFELLENEEMICVRGEKSLMDGRLIIARQSGVIFITWEQ